MGTIFIRLMGMLKLGLDWPLLLKQNLVKDKYAIAVINKGKNCWKCSKVLNETDIFLSKRWWQTTYYSDWAKKVFCWFQARWIRIACRLLFYFVKTKTVSSNERKDIGRDAEVWEAEQKEGLEQEKEKKKENWRLKKMKKICEVFFLLI